MWKMILTNEDIQQFMERMLYFHDSCIKEIYYLSGAYVSDDLSMYPINDRRILRVVVQRQYEKDSMIEIEFQGIKELKLFPVDENYTCEILNSTMIMEGRDIYWYDSNDTLESALTTNSGIFIRASKLKWRSIEHQMGAKSFYCVDDQDKHMDGNT